MKLETKRLALICCNKEILEAAIKGDQALADLLHINIPEKWTEFGAPAFQFSLEKMNANKDEECWWTYLPVLKEENMLIGSGGYKGKPNMEGSRNWL